MFGFNSCATDPRVVGARWRDLWLERLEESGLWLRQWLEQQRRDGYWKHASVCEDSTRSLSDLGLIYCARGRAAPFSALSCYIVTTMRLERPEKTPSLSHHARDDRPSPAGF